MIVNANSLHIPLRDKSVHCCVTSPPYYGLRNYGVDGQLGLEKTPEEYIENTVTWAREVWRVLRDDGTFWLNLGDSYFGSGKGIGSDHGKSVFTDNEIVKSKWKHLTYKPKDLMLMPARVALALQADGWWVRSDIIWAKPNPMPESVTDRPTRSHEYIFLLTKSAKYFYDADAIKDMSSTYENRPHGVVRNRVYGYDSKENNNPQAYLKNIKGNMSERGVTRTTEGLNLKTPEEKTSTRNKRSVWTIATQPYGEAHFATFPEKLIVDPIKAGTSEKGCCSECGAPWERVVEKEKGKPVKSCQAYQGNANPLRGSEKYRPTISSKTIGWQPTCTCNAEVVPCTVLDPFGGSGTTKNVAERLGRRAVILELSSEYIEIAKKRCWINQMELL